MPHPPGMIALSSTAVKKAHFAPHTATKYKNIMETQTAQQWQAAACWLTYCMCPILLSIHSGFSVLWCVLLGNSSRRGSRCGRRGCRRCRGAGLLLRELLSEGLLPGLDDIRHHRVYQRQGLYGPAIKYCTILQGK